MIHHWGNTIASNAKLFEPFYCAIISTFCIFCNWTACSVCFGYLERKLSSAGGFGCTCVAVDTFDFFNIKKNNVSNENPCCIQYLLFYISCTVLCWNIVGQCHIIKTSRQAGSHVKLIFVKDFPCKIEIRDIYMKIIGLPMKS